MTNYVVTFIDQNYIDNILKVWLPSLKRNFSGKIVVITFDVSQESIEELKRQDVMVIEHQSELKGYRIISERLNLQEQFINSLENNDKIMLIDGADVIFQSNIDQYFNTINNKIYYSTTGTLSNRITLKWMKKLLKNSEECKEIFKQLRNTEIIASGMLLGNKNTFLKYFQKHKNIMIKFNAKYFTGINQIILTYLVMTDSEIFEKTYIHNCRIFDNEVIKEKGIYKYNKIIPIIHFSGTKAKPIYNKEYLNIISSPEKTLNILWLYGSVPTFDAINHWYHVGFARIIANFPNINLLLYGYDMEKIYPDLAKIPFNPLKTGKDLKKEFDFDIIIMDNKNRFTFSQTLSERRKKKPRTFWLKSEFFNELNNIPKIFLEGDYHLHFLGHPEEESWYRDRKIDLLLVRHLSALKYHKDISIPIKWFPCSVNTAIFNSNINEERINKICLVSGYGINYYPYRNTAGKILQSENLIDIYNKRFIGDNYIKNLQSYISHLSGSSIRSITPAKMFEIMASGSVLLTDEGSEYGLNELFPNNTYCTYNKINYSDIIPKAKQIINEPDFRRYITGNAIKCIKDKHSHVIRAKELLQIITKEFGISYKLNENNDLGLIEKICKFFSKPIEVTTDIPEKIIPVINKEPIILPKSIIEEDKELENLNILKKLNKKNIKICLLKDTCYNVILNNKIGNTLNIAVNNINIAKKLVGNEIDFQEFPKEVRQFEYENIIFYVPYPIMNYLKSEYGLKAEIEFSKKNKILKLIKKNTYEFCKRKKRK